MKHRYIFSTALALAFVAWQALSLRVNAQETDKWTTVLHETFDSFTKGAHNTANAPSEDLKVSADATLKDFDLSKSKGLYEAGGAVLLHGDKGALLITKPMDFSGEEIKVTIKAKSFETSKYIYFRFDKEDYDSENETVTATYEEDYEVLEILMPAGDENCALKIYTRDMGIFGAAPSIYIDEIKVEAKNRIEPTPDPTLVVTPNNIIFEDCTPNEESYAKEINIKGLNLENIPTYKLEQADPSEAIFTVTGTLTKEGGKLSVVFKPLKPGVHEAKIEIASGELKESIQLKGRGLGGNPVAGLPTDAPLTELKEAFATEGLPKGWSTSIAGGYEDWKIVPSSFDATNMVATMDISSTPWDLGMAYLVSPCLNNPEKHIPEVSFDFAMLKGKALFTTTSFMAYLIAPDGTMGNPIFEMNYEKQPDYATLKKVTVKAPNAPQGKYFLAVAYKGASTAAYSTGVEVDNIEVKSMEDTATTDLATGEAKVWRTASTIYFSDMKGCELKVYALDGSLLISFPKAQDGSVSLVDADQRVVVRYGEKSLLL